MATTKKLSRQKRVLTMLQTQLNSGVKLLKDSSVTVPLSSKDIERINKEINILKIRIT